MARLRSPELIGRDGEVATLAGAVARAVAGDGSVLLIGGDAGIGKSRLLQELARLAHDAGATVLPGGCVDLGEGGLPFAPLLEMMRSLRRSADPATLSAAVEAVGPELVALVPGLGATPATGPANPARVFEAVVALIDRLASDRPVVLAVEDVHWSDASTRELLALLARAVTTAPVVLAVTFRTDELHRRHPLRPLLAQLERVPGATRLDLARLERDDVARLARAIRGRLPSPEEVDALWRRSEGNPFFAEELLAAGEGGALPVTLRDALTTRLAVLTEPVQEVLRAAAAAGPVVDDTVLAAALQRPPEALEPALRDLVGAGVLESSPPDGYRFRHALLQEALYDELLPGERARLHTRIAEALAGQPDRAAELAHHWHLARRAPEALAASVTAAAQAMAVGAPADAASHYDRALELWEVVPDAAERAGASLRDVLARAATAADLSGQFTRAIGWQREAIALTDVSAEPAAAAVMHERLGHYLWTADRDAWPAFDDAVRLVPEEPSLERAKVLAGYAAMLMLAGFMPRGIEASEAALAVAVEVGDRVTEAHARNTLGTCLVNEGDGRGLDELLRSLRIAEESGDPETISRGYVNLSHSLILLLRWDEAIDVARRGLAVTRRLGLDRTHGVYVEANLSEALAAVGQWDEALAREAATAARLPTGGWEYFRIGPLRGDRGDLDGLRAEVDGAPELPGGDAVLQGLTRHVAGRATLALWEGRPRDVRATVDAALERMPPSLLSNEGGIVLWPALRAEADVAAASRAAGDTAGVADACAAADRFLDSVETAAAVGGGPRRRLQPYVPLCRAEHARATGAERVEDWQAAVAAAEDAGMVYLGAYARWRAAEAAVRAGDRAAASTLAARAAATAEALGARPLLAEVRELVRRARLAPPADTPGADGGGVLEPSGAGRFALSPREREVLALVADGRSNRQIADALFISPKTASVHVSNILGKLGVATRGEAAAAAHRHGLLDGGP